MLLMDRENLLAPGWSHVVSTTDDVAELEALRVRVGAPPPAFSHKGRRPHLDLKWEARERALVDPEVRVFETTRELLRYLVAGRGSAGVGEGRKG
ncbi:MAG TPA: hypothetical protein VG940_00005 [Gemmatimonadales bacterium]|nr:hypothetical protein [Gemmatimonadales bacterium]